MQLQSPEHSVPPFIPDDDRIPNDLLLLIPVTITQNNTIITKTPNNTINTKTPNNPINTKTPKPEIPETPETQPILAPKKVRFVPNILKRSKHIINKPNTQSSQPEPKKKSKFMPNILKRSNPKAKK